MIKAKITKNIIRKNNNSFGISTKQMIIAGAAAILGILMYLILRNHMNTQLLMTLIFIVLGVIIFFGCVNIQGMSLFTFFVKTFKGADVRYYETKGVFSDDNRYVQEEE
ncbi:PrgI family protein [Ruminococcus sp. XPD3002]|uniref:PrgI family protein n=1 Tax=Ruminococcus sp. XPD3002 TaxID=1452269 RepID=UPI0009160CD9|nr:PrgI family protein [Ruminococcus flavefaciens]